MLAPKNLWSDIMIGNVTESRFLNIDGIIIRRMNAPRPVREGVSKGEEDGRRSPAPRAYKGWAWRAGVKH
jgi:hypothetical protein